MDDEVFVGRGEELDLLRGLLAGVVAGVGATVLVEGEQGIGKTTLLRHVFSAAGDRCHLAWATADEPERRFPLGLITDCFGPQGALAATGEAADPGAAGEYGRHHVLSGDPVLAGVERMLALADRLCAAGPLVVVAEDLQWADEASVLVWHQLSRATRQAPLLVVGSLRPAPVREDLARVRRAVTARGGHLVTLGPLAPPEVSDLVGKVVGGQPGHQLAQLAERAGGNPLYARELADALVRGEQVRVTAGIAELTGRDADVRVPVSLAGAISARLASLSDDVTAALHWAAVLGQEFSIIDLEVVTRLDAGALIKVVGEAVAAGVTAEAGPRMRFRHGLIREAVYESMPVSLRSALHLQAARALAEAGAAPERVAAQLVAAPDIADRWVRDWLIKAAPVLAYRAPQVTADLLRGALVQVTKDDQDRELLETVLVQVEFLLGRDDEVERVGRKLLASTHDPDRAAEVAWLVAYTVMRTVRAADAASMIEQALTRPGLSEVHTARLSALYSMTLIGSGRADEGIKVAGEALAKAEAIGDPLATGYAMQSSMWHVFQTGDFAEMLDRTDQTLDVIGDDPATIDLHLLLLMNRFTLLGSLDRPAEALAAAQQALALGERAGTSRLREIHSNLAAFYFDLGQWDDALIELESVVAAPEPELQKVLARALVALIGGHRDDSAALEEHLAAIKGVPVGDIAWAKPIGEAFLARAVAAERAGHPDEAEAALAECLEPKVAQYIGIQNDVVLPMLTRLAVTAGHDDAAAAACAVAVEGVGDPTAAHCRGLVESDPAALMAVADTYLPATRPLHRALALEDAAVAYAKRTELRAARAVAIEALDLYEALGASWDIRRAVARLRPLRIRRRPHSSHRPDFGWDALTPTELKIAYLVADTQSNPDIAAALCLSRNTVQTHVSHILTKLGARSRAQIAHEVTAHPPIEAHLDRSRAAS